MKRQMTEENAIIRLEALCARAEHCTSELRKKLQGWGITSSATERIIDSLQERRFVDDQRFARAYVREKYLLQRWGRNKIISNLYAKRIDRDTIDTALEEIEARPYAANAFRLVSAKLRSLPEEMPAYEKRQRLFRFGVGRGYESSLIMKILESRRLWKQ